MFDLKVSLWQQQQLMSNYAHERDYAWWLAGCGLGKTLAAIDLLRRSNAKRSVILTMKALIEPVWVEEFKEFTEGARILPLTSGTTRTKQVEMESFWHTGPGTVIVNYETAYRMNFLKWKPDFVFADESHKLKGYNGKISSSLATQFGKTDLRVAGTGTGWEDKPLDVFGQVRFLKPFHYPRNRILGSFVLGRWSDFFEQHTIYRILDNIKIPQSYKNLEQLADKLRPFTLVLKREDYLDLTASQIIPVRFDLPKKHMAKYQEMKHQLFTRFDDDAVIADNALVKALRLHQISSGFYRPEDENTDVPIPGGDIKLRTFSDLAETFGDEPFIVYALFRTSIAMIRNQLSMLGISHGELSSSANDVTAWRKGRCQALVIQLQAGNAGLNLTRAKFVVYYELSGSNTDYIQSQYRVSRPGQKRDVAYYHLLARNTVDTALLRRSANKSDAADKLRGLI